MRLCTIVSLVWWWTTGTIVTAADAEKAHPQGNDRPQLVVRAGHSGRVKTVHFSPDGKQVLTGSEDNTARVWDATSGQELFTVTFPESVQAAAFSPDGKQFLVGVGTTAEIRDASSGKRLLVLQHANFSYVLSVAFSPDGKQILTGSSDGIVRRWSISTARELAAIRGNAQRIESVCFSPDGKGIMAACGKSVRIWDSVTSKERSTLAHTDLVRTACFSTMAPIFLQCR